MIVRRAIDVSTASAVLLGDRQYSLQYGTDYSVTYHLLRTLNATPHEPKGRLTERKVTTSRTLILASSNNNVENLSRYSLYQWAKGFGDFAVDVTIGNFGGGEPPLAVGFDSWRSLDVSHDISIPGAKIASNI
nr:hypothetical protein HmN_000953000 [Hymenolepis microstoma]